MSNEKFKFVEKDTAHWQKYECLNVPFLSIHYRDEPGYKKTITLVFDSPRYYFEEDLEIINSTFSEFKTFIANKDKIKSEVFEIKKISGSLFKVLYKNSLPDTGEYAEINLINEKWSCCFDSDCNFGPEGLRDIANILDQLNEVKDDT